MSKDKDDLPDSGFTSAGVAWAHVPEFARQHVAWIDGRSVPSTPLPSIDVVPTPDILNHIPYLHEARPRGSKAMADAHGAKARLHDARPGAWLVSPFTGWQWAKWPSRQVGWLPSDIELPASLRVWP